MPTPSPPSSDIPGFHGRDRELAWLRDLFEDVAETRVPRLAVVVAESGFGKSRLVQALYQQLTVDPTWDPEAHDYWPDAFQDDGDSLRVNPELAGHTPQGPPQFMWLGMRWHPTDERNLNERICPLPEARDTLRRHHEIARLQLPFWKELLARGGDSVGDLTIETLTDAGADAIGIPGFNILKAGFKTISETIAGRQKEIGHHDATQQDYQDAGEAFIDLLSKLGAGPNPLPTVLWLDDAQWIDSVTLQMLGALFERAKSQNWPLLVVSTHWEQEWRQGLLERDDMLRTSLAGFAAMDFSSAQDGTQKTEICVLDAGDDSGLRETLFDRLPGLTHEQQTLLIERAAGNFLTMVENVGELRKRTRNFVNRNLLGPLSEQGERRILTWESDRERRVQQRFDSLRDEVRDLLGWGSHIGHRFIAEVVTSLAKIRDIPESRNLLRACIDPSAILSEPNPYLREFRDRAFHRVAVLYFETDLADDSSDLTQILRRYLTAWTNACFDAEGDLHLQTLDSEINAASGVNIPTAPKSSVLDLAPAERTDLLRMATTHLLVPKTPDWTNLDTQAALRARCLLVAYLAEDGLWDQAREEGKALSGIDWMSVPTQVCSTDFRWSRIQELQMSGANAAGEAMTKSVLANQLAMQKRSSSTELERSIAMSLYLLSDFMSLRGDHTSAYQRLFDGLEISRRIATEEATPESLRELALWLDRIGETHLIQDHLEAAHDCLFESLTLRKSLAGKIGNPESRRDLLVSLNMLGEIDEKQGHLDAAACKYQDSLELAKQLHDELDTPESLRDVCIALNKTGDLAQLRGDISTACERYAESLISLRALANALGTPTSFRDMSILMNQIGAIEEKRGDLDAASEMYREALEIRRKLAKAIDTPQSYRDLSVSLSRIGDIEAIRGGWPSAQDHFCEALNVRRQLAEKLDTPESQRDVSVSLNRIAGLHRELGDFSVAQDHFAESLQIIYQLLEGLRIPDNFRDYRSALLAIGQNERDLGRFDAAQTRIAMSLEIGRKLARESESLDDLFELANILSQMSELEQSRGNIESARRWQLESLELSRSCTRDDPGVRYQFNLSRQLRALGNIDAAKGAIGCSHKASLESLRINERNADGSATPESLHELAESLAQNGSVLAALGNFKSARSDLQKAEMIGRELKQKLGTPQRSLDHSYYLSLVAQTEQFYGDLDSAYERLEDILNTLRGVFKNFHASKVLADISGTLIRIGEIDYLRENLADARNRFLEASRISHWLAMEHQTPASNRDLALSLSKLGDLDRYHGDLTATYEKYAVVLEIRRGISEGTDSPVSRNEVSASLNKLANIEFAQGRSDAAYERYHESLSIARDVAEEGDAIQAFFGVAVLLLKLGDVDYARNEVDAAKKWITEGYEIARRITETIPAPQNFSLLANAVTHLGFIEQLLGNRVAAHANFLEGLELRQSVAQDLRTPQSFRDVSASLNQLGEIELARGDLEAALGYKTEQLQIDLELGDPATIRATYASAIQLADAAGNADQAAAWRAELTEFDRSNPESEKEDDPAT